MAISSKSTERAGDMVETHGTRRPTSSEATQEGVMEKIVAILRRSGHHGVAQWSPEGRGAATGDMQAGGAMSDGHRPLGLEGRHRRPT